MDQKKIIPFAFVIAFMCIYPHSALFAQDGVLINYTGGSRASSAILDLQSSDQGLLAPRVALTATNAASPITSPATSLLVYNTATAGTPPNDVIPGYYYWDGSWKRLMSGNTTPLSGSGAATRVAFWDGVNSLSSDAALYWDNTNKRLGVGTGTPGQSFDVTGASRFRNTMNFGVTDNEGLISWSGNMGNGEAGLVIRGQIGRGILLGANNASHVMINLAGNVGIGTATGPGQKLDVAGGSIRTTHQLMSTIATGTSPMQVSSTTLNTNLNADLLDGWHASQLQFQQSNRNFLDGTLIQTNIDYSVVNGEPWLLEIEGNSYGDKIPFDIKIQGYIYSSTVIHYGGISNGTNITGISLFNYGGKLCFWFPRQAYWHGFSVFVTSSYAGTKNNRLVSITDVAKPAAITKEVDLSSSIEQSWHSGNFTPSSYAPTTGGTGYIQNQVAADQAAGFRINGNGLFNGGNVAVGSASAATRLDVNGYVSFTPNNLASFQQTGGKGILFNNVQDMEWLGSTFGSGFGHRLYGIDPGGQTQLRLAIRNNTATWTDLVTFSSLGRVGINTTDPQTLLHLNLGAGGANSTPAIRIDGKSGYPSLEFGIKGDYDGVIKTFGNNLHLYAGHWRTSGTPATENHNMSFYTSQAGSTDWETPKMFINHDGNVGVGTTAPVSKLEIEGGAANWNEAVPGLVTGSIHLDPGATSANIGNAITWGAHDSGNGDSGQAGIYVRSNGSYGTKMYFGTTSSYAAGSKTQMMIDALGNVGIGTVSPDYKLQIAGDVVPETDVTYDLGKPALRWNNLYVNSIQGPGALWTRSGTQLYNTNQGDNVGIGTTSPGATLHVRNGLTTANSITTILANGNTDVNFELVTRKGASPQVSGDVATQIGLRYSAGDKANAMLRFHRGGGTTGGFMSFSTSSDIERMRINTDGNVGINTATPNQKLHVAGGTEIEAAAIEGNAATRIFRNLVSNSWDGGQTGALVIQTNVPQDEHTMTQTWINWKRSYSQGATNNQIIASGYWSSEGNGGFQGLGYTSQGGEKLRVRFMRNSSTGMVAIVIGETNTSWSYPNISVTKMSAHYGLSDSYAAGWTASFDTNLSGFTNSDDVPNVTSPGQGASVYSLETEINLASNNTGTYSSSAGAGWTPGTWQDVSSFSVARTITAGNMVQITAEGLVEGDNYNYFVPSCIYFRLLRGSTEIARTAVYMTPASYVPSNFWFFNSGNFSMNVVETSTSGSQTYKVQYWMPDESSSFTEYVRIGSRRLNVVETNQQ